MKLAQLSGTAAPERVESKNAWQWPAASYEAGHSHSVGEIDGAQFPWPASGSQNTTPPLCVATRPSFVNRCSRSCGNACFSAMQSACPACPVPIQAGGPGGAETPPARASSIPARRREARPLDSPEKPAAQSKFHRNWVRWCSGGLSGFRWAVTYWGGGPGGALKRNNDRITIG